MKNEENVDVETTQAEDVAMAISDGDAVPTEGASTVLGKFKDVDALARAYGALEAEFTRRSQKLRALEKEMENFKNAESTASGAEKLRKTAKARRDAAKAFDAFVADVDTVAAKKPAPIEEKPSSAASARVAEAVEGSEEMEKGQEVPTGEVATATEPELGCERETGAGSGDAGSFSQSLFERAVADEDVRLRIVGEYLASLGKQGVPLTAAGAGVLATPPKRAKTVGQAGDMALLYFRKPTGD